MSWSMMVIGICVVLLLFSVWKEYKRTNKAHLLLRIVAVTIAVAALACVVLPLSYQSHQQVADNQQGILLTEGFNSDTLKKYPDLPVFTSAAAIKKEYPKAILVNTLSQIKTEHPQVTQLHILGYGLDEDELKLLGNIPVLFHPAARPTGVNAISWGQNIKSGEVLKVQGKFNNPTGKTYQLLLKGLDVTLDSISIKANGNNDFELHAIPKTTGNVVYDLVVTSGKDTLEDEHLPLHIEPVKPVKVLILSSSPDFENRFLKNWLSAHNYVVYTRTTISKNKFSTEAVNAKQVSLTTLSTATLQNFDVVLGDVSALQGLTAPEASALKQQVTQNGLGLIVRADSTGKISSWFQYSFPLVKTSGQTQSATALILSGQTAATEKLNTDPVGIVYKQGTQVLVNDVANRVLVSSSLAGAGKLVFSTISDTYNWMLNGDENDYTAYWSLLISKASRKAELARSVNLVNDVPQVGHETEVWVLSGTSPDSVKLGAVQPAFSQSVGMPFSWSAPFWPERPGWQTATNGSANLGDVYVYDDKDWNNIKNNRKIFVTNSYAKENLLNWTDGKQTAQTVSKQIPKIWFYLLFLMAVSYLWAEAKFGSV